MVFMNYELRCEKLCENYHENPAELNLVDKGFLDLEAANFWSCVEIKSALDCWPWLGGKSHAISVREKTIQSHKMAWCLAADLSAVPKGKRLLILCSDRKSTRLNSSHANISYAVF